ncbi:hypothetical protein AHiyo6_04000 [Arthrobacter sp. Hiyo6]|nr:hypothetical protein AHiyo6_04000 [Arthrobacter sp. Hiyo6]
MKAMILEDNDWPADALATIIGLANKKRRFSADDLSREMRRPPHPNMAGQAFSAAKALGVIEPVGYRTSTNKTRKNGVLRTWRRKINKEVAK